MSDERTQPDGSGSHRRVFVILGVCILLVVGAVATLAFVVRRSVGSYTDRANVQVTKTQLIQVEMAIRQFRLERRKLPVRLDELVGPDAYLDSTSVPTDAWGHPFVYAADEEDRLFELRSLGRDGRVGGSGLYADIDLESAHSRDE